MTLAIIFESVGAGEWLVLLAVVLIVVGPKRLPETARKFGQHYAKFRRAAESFKRQLLEMDTEISNAVSEAEREVEAAAKDADPDLASSEADGAAVDPGEYHGYDGEYPDDTDYDGYAGEPEKAEEPPAPAPEPKNGIRISVSSLPDSKKAEA